MLSVLPRRPRGRLPVSPKARTAPAAVTVPSYFAAATESQWATAGSNTLQSVSSVASLRSLTMPWIGMAVDQSGKRGIIGAPGGHGDGGDNSVYALSLGSDSPAWTRLRAGDTGGVSDTENSAGTTTSGNPSSTHSYHRPVFAAGRFWLAGLDSLSGSSGWWTTSTFSYDCSQTDANWNRHGRLLTSGSINKWLGGSAAYDSVTDRLYSVPQFGAGDRGAYFDVGDVVAAGNVEHPNAVTGVTAITIPGWFTGNSFSAMVAAEDLRLLIWLVDENGLLTLDLDNPGAGWTSRTMSGTPPTVNGGGFVYHPGTRKCYGYDGNGGTTVRVMDIPTTLSNTWAWRTVNLAGGSTPTATGSDNGSGGYSRFNIVHNMGDGRAMLVWVPNHTTTGFYFARLPAAGL